MNKNVQIRSLPEATHRELKVRAATEGFSISEYLKRLIERELKKPSWADFEARMKNIEPTMLPESTAEMIRRERDSR